MAKVSIRVSKETQDILRNIAEQEHRPMSAITDEALRAYQEAIALWDSTSSDGLQLSDSAVR